MSFSAGTAAVQTATLISTKEIISILYCALREGDGSWVLRYTTRVTPRIVALSTQTTISGIIVKASSSIDVT